MGDEAGGVTVCCKVFALRFVNFSFFKYNPIFFLFLEVEALI